MPLIVKSTGGNIPPIKPGVHSAVCVGCCDTGTHFNPAFGNRTHRVTLTWEIQGERIELMKDGELIDAPRQISKTYTASLHEKSHLHKDLKSWRGRAFTEKELKSFDLFALLGRNCQLYIMHEEKNGKIYAKIQSILPPMPGKKPLKAESPVLSYCFESHGVHIPELVPGWIREQIQKSDEWQKLVEPQQQATDEAPPWDDVPEIPDPEDIPEEVRTGSYQKPADRSEVPF